MSIESRTDLNTYVDTYFDANGAQLITGPILNAWAKNINDSAINKLGDSGILGVLTYASLFSLSNDGDLVYKKYLDDSLTGYLPLSAGAAFPLTGDLYIGAHSIISTNTNAIQNASNANNYLQVASGGVVLGTDAILTLQGSTSVDLQAGSSFRVKLNGAALGADRIFTFPNYNFAFPSSGPASDTFLKYNGIDYVWAAAGGGSVTSVSGTADRITSTGGSTPVIDISATFEALLGKVASPLSQFAATTSAQLAGVISDETGSGALVFANTPTLVTPVIGAATGTSLVLSGTISAAADTDATNILGRGRFASPNTDIIYFGHFDQSAATGMAFSQTSAGQTVINAPTGQVVAIAINGSTQVVWNSTTMTFSDNKNIAFNTGTGTKMGTGITQKFAFWNAVPIGQPASANQAAVAAQTQDTLTDSTGGTANTTLVTVDTLGVADPAKVNDNFADIAAQLAKIKTDVANIKTFQNQWRTDAIAIGLIKGAA